MTAALRRQMNRLDSALQAGQTVLAGRIATDALRLTEVEITEALCEGNPVALRALWAARDHLQAVRQGSAA